MRPTLSHAATPEILLQHNSFFLVHHPSGIQMLFFHDRAENVYVCYGFLKHPLSMKEVDELRISLDTGTVAGLREALRPDMEIITEELEKMLAYADIKSWTRARNVRGHELPTKLYVEDPIAGHPTLAAEQRKVYARYGFTPVSYTSLFRERYGYVRTFATAAEATACASVLGIFGKSCTISWKRGKEWTNVTNVSYLGDPSIGRIYFSRRLWEFDPKQSKQQAKPRATKANPLWGMRGSVSGPVRAVRAVARTHGVRTRRAVPKASPNGNLEGDGGAAPH